MRCSPDERTNRSTSGMSGSSRYCRKRASVILLGIESSRGGQLGDPPGRVDDLGPAAVVHAELQSEHVVVDSASLRLLQLGDHASPQPRPAPRPADPDPHRVHLVAPTPDHVPVEAHQPAHLVGRAAPVLGRERVRRQVLSRRSRWRPRSRRTTSPRPVGGLRSEAGCAPWPSARCRPSRWRRAAAASWPRCSAAAPRSHAGWVVTAGSSGRVEGRPWARQRQ